MAKTTKKATKGEAPPRKAGAKDAALQSALAGEVQHLRAQLREMSRRFVNKLESEMVRTTELAGEIPGGAKKRAAMQNIIQSLRNVKVKPDKGRFRDLKEVRDLVRETNQRLEELL